VLVPLIKASAEGEPDQAKGTNQDQRLSYSEVIGNCFILTFAGHETSANMMHFSLLFLAINLVSQSRLQADIDAIAAGRPPSTWAYSTDMRLFYNSMVGAVMNETLRLIPPVPAIPKTTFASQSLTIDGKSITLPAGTYIHINVVGTNRNTKYYPHQPSKVASAVTDINDFVPERWLLAGNSTSTSTSTAADSNSSSGTKDDLTTDGLETVSYELSSTIYKPPKGAFMSFSDGGRACPGRRFAQVEIVAVLAVIFNAYSVELDVSAWASDADVARMSPSQKRDVYARAADRARALIRGSEQTITLKMERERVPVRFVRRGAERFRDVAI
jgi:cytochrome P450